MMIVCERCERKLKSRGKDIFVVGTSENSQKVPCDVCGEIPDEVYFTDEHESYDSDLEPDY